MILTISEPRQRKKSLIYFSEISIPNVEKEKHGKIINFSLLNSDVKILSKLLAIN